MKVLFVAYCMINNENGDSLIGVYKRALRIGLEMARRGHEVWMFCTGRQGYQDDLTRQAEQCIHFLDFPFELHFATSIKLLRRYYRMVFRRLGLDMVILGEAPLAGPLLESALCAVSLNVRVVILDNAYSPNLAQEFIRWHGPMVDGIVLTGPSSFHTTNAPEYYCAASPYIEGSSEEAQALIHKLQLDRARLITVLSYERKAEQLGAALLPSLIQHDCGMIFISPDPEGTRARLEPLAAQFGKWFRIVPPPGEELLFGLFQSSNLVIGKCGFMQVTECLAVRTPFLGIQYRGCFPVELLPRNVARFVHATSVVQPDQDTLEAAVRLLHVSPDQLNGVHDGHFGARSQVVNFLERLSPAPRNPTEEFEKFGYPSSLVTRAIANFHRTFRVKVKSIRCNRLRTTDWGYLDSIACIYTVHGTQQCLFLRGHMYKSGRAAKTAAKHSSSSAQKRKILAKTFNWRVFLEEDLGQPLPPM